MGFWNKYPMTNFHELNLDWVLSKIKELDYTVKHWVSEVTPIIRDTVNTWLNEHPEATTTVQDNSLTINKLVNGTLGYVTPQMFGAYADGFTDDTSAINQAMESCAVNGGNVFFPSGTYIINSPISIPSNTKVFGNSGKSIIRTGDSFNRGDFAACMIRNYNSGWQVDLNKNIELNGITLECNSDYAGQMGVIHFGGVSDSIIDNCIIKINGYNCWGIILFSHNNRVLVRNTEIYNNSPEGNLGGCFWLRPATNGAISNDNIVENCYFESSAVDEVFCVGNASYANSETSINVTDTTIVGKATTTKPSFLLTTYLEQATSNTYAYYDNITVKGECTNYGVSFSKTVDSADMNCTITNSIINVSNGGIISSNIDFIAQNCNIKSDSRNSAYKLTLINCILNRSAYGCNAYSCKMKSNASSGFVSCEVVENCIIDTPYNGIDIGTSVVNPVSYQNNIINAGIYGIVVDSSENSFSGIISNNIIKRSLNTNNTGSIGIYIQRNGSPILSGNIIDSNEVEETANRFRYSVSVPNTAKQIQNILPLDDYEQIGSISTGDGATKTITHLEETAYLLIAMHGGGANSACAFIYNSTVTPIVSNAHFTFSSISNTECSVTSDSTTSYSNYRLINLNKTM